MLKTLDSSLQVLAYFTKEHPRWGVRELAKELDMSHSIVYRILATFEKHGFLAQDPTTKKYYLGIKLLEYGSIIRDNLRVSDVIYPIMKKIAEDTGESVFLILLDGLEGILIEKAECFSQVKFTRSVGGRTSLHVGASNKVIMAYLSKEDQEAIIAKVYDDKSQHLKEKLLEDLKKIRRDGWAYSIGEQTQGTFGIAVPLFNRSGEILASLAVAGLEFRMPKENIEKTLQILRQGQSEVQNFVNRYTLDNPFL